MGVERTNRTTALAVSTQPRTALTRRAAWERFSGNRETTSISQYRPAHPPARPQETDPVAAEPKKIPAPAPEVQQFELLLKKRFGEDWKARAPEIVRELRREIRAVQGVSQGPAPVSREAFVAALHFVLDQTFQEMNAAALNPVTGNMVLAVYQSNVALVKLIDDLVRLSWDMFFAQTAANAERARRESEEHQDEVRRQERQSMILRDMVQKIFLAAVERARMIRHVDNVETAISA